MIASDWGDWLPCAVKNAEPDGVSIWYLGCNGFILKGADGRTLFVDPYLGTGDPPRTVRMIPIPFDPEDITEADALLVTHEHTDHVHGPSQGPILEQTGATLFAPDASMDVVQSEGWAETWDLASNIFESVSPGDTFEIGAFTIHVEAAYDPDAEEPVAYIIEHPAGTIFHGGDSKPTDAFEDLGARYDIDLAIVAFGVVGNLFERSHTERKRTSWYCDENQVVEIINALGADRLLPSHWDMWKGMTADPKALHHHTQSWPYPNRVDIVEIGDRIDL